MNSLYGAILLTAAALNSPAVRIVSEPIALHRMEQDAEPDAWFGGQAIEVALKLHHLAAHTKQIEAHLYLQSGTLVTPVYDVAVYQERITLDASAEYDTTYKIQLPQVSRPTKFQLRYYQRDKASDPWQHAHTHQIQAFPDDISIVLKNFASEHAVGVLDSSGRMQSYFKHYEIRAVDLERSSLDELYNASVSKDDRIKPVVFVNFEKDQDVDEYRDLLLQLQAACHVIMIRDSNHRVPRIVIEHHGETTRVELDARLISNIQSNPQSQHTLINIVRKVLGWDANGTIENRKEGR